MGVAMYNTIVKTMVHKDLIRNILSVNDKCCFVLVLLISYVYYASYVCYYDIIVIFVCAGWMFFGLTFIIMIY